METKTDFVKYWIACSGGLDSVVLTRLMHSTKKSIGILHCNFKLRGIESDEDEKFVKELASNLNIPIKVKNIDLSKYKGNIQLEARKKRYEWFKQLIDSQEIYIMLGHHKNDQIETFWQQLERGSSYISLAGMISKNQRYLRPLLKYSKQELLDLAKSNNWKWREDASNQTNKYQRNAFRNNFLPTLKSCNSKIEEDTLKLISHYQHLIQIMQSHDFIKSKKISTTDWKKLPEMVKKHILWKNNIPTNQTKALDLLTKSQKGAFKKYKHCEVWKENDSLFFNDSPAKRHYSFTIKLVQNKAFVFHKSTFYIDADKLKGPLQIGTWEKGEYFNPLGLKGKKLISNYLVDKKVPAHFKSHVLVLRDDEKVVGIQGQVPSEKVKITKKTKCIFAVTIYDSWKNFG